MQKNYNVTGEQRKKMVQIISQEVGMEPVYMRMPTCAYAISNITVGKAGEMVWDERTDEKVIAKVLDALAAAGFTAADPEPGAPAEESGEETGTPEDENTTSLTVEMPRDTFTEEALINLQKIIDSKATLLKKSLGTEELPVMVTEEKVAFPYVIDSGAGPFKPSNPGMAEEDKTEYQLTKTVSDKITTFTMGDVLENEDQNGKTYTYYVEEVSATGGAGILYNTYYGNVSEGSIVWRPDAKHAGDGEVIINLEYSGCELPSTGGQGTRLFYLVGCLLTVLAGAGLVMKKKLKESV